MHLLALFWGQYFVQVEIVFHAVITRLLFDIAERGKLFFVWRLSGIRFDAIKIESGMFHQFRTSEWQLRVLVNQFRGLGERVVIEGVETPQDYAICRMSGADAVQGFLFEQEVLPKGLNHC